MKKYKKPTLVSYKPQDIVELVGPALGSYTVVGKQGMKQFRAFQQMPRLVKKSGE